MAQVLPVFLGDAHHLRDHAHGQRGGQRLEHVHPAVRLHLVEQLGDRLADERAPPLHRLGREVLVHGAPHRLVRRPVVLDELVGAERAHLLEERPIGGRRSGGCGGRRSVLITADEKSS